MTVQGDGPERSYLRVTIPEPLAVALDLDERGLRAAASTTTDRRAVIPLGGETRMFDIEPLGKSPVYQTGDSGAVQTYLPSPVGDAIAVDVGDRVRVEVVLAGERPRYSSSRPTTRDRRRRRFTGPARAIHSWR